LRFPVIGKRIVISVLERWRHARGQELGGCRGTGQETAISRTAAAIGAKLVLAVAMRSLRIRIDDCVVDVCDGCAFDPAKWVERQKLGVTLCAQII